jgi:hypothetical protein
MAAVAPVIKASSTELAGMCKKIEARMDENGGYGNGADGKGALFRGQPRITEQRMSIKPDEKSQEQ